MKWIAIWVVLVAGMGTSFAEDLYTNVYVVPPTFLNTGESNASDPFAAPQTSGKLKPRPTAKVVLETAGITFGPGASAIYNPGNSQLIVRNTQDQMELVEAYIESIKTGVEKQIYVMFREVTFDKDSLTDTFGPELFMIPENKALPDGSVVKSVESKEKLLEELRRPPRIPGERKGQKAITGVFTDPQFQVMIREIERNKSLDLVKLPSIMCRSGQAGLCQVDEKRYGVIPVLGADEFTVDLQLFLPRHGDPLSDQEAQGSGLPSITIWDGQTVAVTEVDREGSGRIVFVRAQIMDPAGMPIHGNRLPENQRPPDLTDQEKRLVKEADEAALRGSQHLANGELTEAAANYKKALSLLPEYPITGERRKAYSKQFETILTRLGKNPKPSSDKSQLHVVSRGESIFQIAKKYDQSVDQIKDYNQLRSDTLEVGQLLRIPTKKGRHRSRSRRKSR